MDQNSKPLNETDGLTSDMPAVDTVTVGTKKKRKVRLLAPISDPALVALASSQMGSSKTRQAEPPPPAATFDNGENKPIAYIDRGLPLPDGYGLDRLVALVRDPQWVFTYWELNGSRLNDVRGLRGQTFIDSCAWVLRVHRVAERIAIDVEIDPSVGCWYLDMGKPGRYQFELGLLSPDGEWISLLASHLIETPLSEPSEIIDDEWRMRPEDEALLLGQALELAESRKRGVSGFLGASRLQSSFALASSMMMLGSSASGKPVSTMGSWMHSFQGASRVSGSGGSGGLGWAQSPTGALEPLLERPAAQHGGPNWNAQPQLSTLKDGKAQSPHFKVKLPRTLAGLPLPAPSWPPVGRAALRSR